MRYAIVHGCSVCKIEMVQSYSGKGGCARVGKVRGESQ